MTEILQLVGAALFSVASGGVVVFSLSTWLGKVWANRILETDRQEFSREMTKLQQEYHKDLQQARSELEIYKETVLRIQNDKLAIYRVAVDIVADMLSHFDAVILKHLPNLPPEKYHDFNRRRMQLYGYLAMLAPQDVMDAHDELLDYLFMVIQGSAAYDWKKEVRPKVLNLLNCARADVGIDKNAIEYKGRR